MKKLFPQRNPRKMFTGTIDYEKNPFDLNYKQVKRLNKGYEGKSHFIGFVDLCAEDAEFCELLKSSLAKQLGELKDNPSSAKSSVSKKSSNADQQLLIEDDNDEDYESMSNDSEVDLDADEFGESSSAVRKKIAGFQFSQVALKLALPKKSPNSYTASISVIKKILTENLLLQHIDEEGSYLFKALLPSKNEDFSQRIQHWLAGFIVVSDSPGVNQSHIACEKLTEKLNDLQLVIKQAYTSNNVLMKCSSELCKISLVFMSTDAKNHEMSPANSNLESLASPCLTCLELKSSYDCKFATDLSAAMCILLDQDLVKLFPEIIRLVNMKLSGLY